MTTTRPRYREHQYLNHFVCSSCEGSSDVCRMCHGTGLQPCLLTAGCEAPADLLSAHDEGTPACQACEEAAAADAKKTAESFAACSHRTHQCGHVYRCPLPAGHDGAHLVGPAVPLAKRARPQDDEDREVRS